MSGDTDDGISMFDLLTADRQAMNTAWSELGEHVERNADLTAELQQRLNKDVMDIWFGEPRETVPSDPRFNDPDWQNNPWYNRIANSYGAWAQMLDEWLERADLEALDRQRGAFLFDIAKAICSPANSPFAPQAMRRALETNGASWVNGVANYLDDQQHNHGYPAVADRDAFVIGRDVANTPGQVVYRDERFELIQYTPTTTRVRKRPLLYVFSQVNRFYLGDLTEDRSLFRQMLQEGIQVFAVSWRNPDAEHATWSLADYAQSVITAVQVIRRISGVRKVDLMGLCAGGLTAAVAAGVLCARNKNWIKSLSLFVSILDNQPGDSGFSLFNSDETVSAQKARVRAQGGLREQDVLEMFAVLRLDDNVFSFMRSNYFLGEHRLAHPLLFWSMDYTRVPAEMQCDLIDLSHENKLKNETLTALGETVSLSQIDYPVYIMAGSTDHITPWPACYRSTALFGGDVQFVLTNQNHTQTISAKANPHLRYHISKKPLPADHEAWLAQAREYKGDWREHWISWLKSHSRRVDAPQKMGSKRHPPLMAAPGEYVLGK